jgi:3-phosphoshikimate 1-carboxyvinyltransferase
VNRPIPSDFSSATFFLAAGALPGNSVECLGLDMTDTQGDKAVVDYLRAMNATVVMDGDSVRVEGGSLRGCEIDMNATPDALPMMAVLACFAEGTTLLANVPQARLKETDRIHVMRTELEKMGGCVTELPDGLVIEKSTLHGAHVEGHGDHRVIMALGIAGTQTEGTTTIHGADAVDVTYPGFAEALRVLGGRVASIEG